jgi:negative regulator of flagellin synthesis FlgM
MDERTPNKGAPRHGNERSDIMEQPVGEALFPDPDIRQDLVERIRREIAAGTYETPEKWELALERLIQHLEQE